MSHLASGEARSDRAATMCRYRLGIAEALEICASVAGGMDLAAISLRNQFKCCRQSVVDDEMVALIEVAATNCRIAPEFGDVGHEHGRS